MDDKTDKKPVPSQENIKKVVDLISQGISLSKLSDEELLDKCRKTEKAKVSGIVNHFKEVYDAPEECVQRMEGYEVYAVPDELYARLAYSELFKFVYDGVDSMKDLDESKLRMITQVLRVAMTSGGVCDSKNKRLFVRDSKNEEEGERTVRHEVLHAMADFDDKKSGFQDDEDLESHEANEAVVEILEISDYYGITPMEMANRMLVGEKMVADGRQGIVFKVLIPLVLTQGTDNEISLKDVASYYWRGDEEGLGEEMDSKAKKLEGNYGEENVQVAIKIYNMVS